MKHFFDSNLNRVEKPEGTDVFWRMSVYALIQRNDTVLMVIPKWNTNALWELPGGGVHLEESIFDAITREGYEETGYDIEVVDKSPIHAGEMYFYHRGNQRFCHSVILIFPSRLVSERQADHGVDTSLNEEISKIAWVPLATCSESNCHPIIWPAIRALKQS